MFGASNSLNLCMYLVTEDSAVLARLKKNSKERFKNVFPLHGLICNYSCIASLLYLVNKKSLVDTVDGIYNA